MCTTFSQTASHYVCSFQQLIGFLARMIEPAFLVHISCYPLLYYCRIKYVCFLVIGVVKKMLEQLHVKFLFIRISEMPLNNPVRINILPVLWQVPYPAYQIAFFLQHARNLLHEGIFFAPWNVSLD